MDVTQLVAANARRIREEKKLTLEGAAACTGVSRSMLAQIERGEVNPTISVLWKMANGYRVSFTSLVEQRDRGMWVIRQADGSPLEEDGGRYVNYPVFPFDEERLFETYRILIAPGGSLAAQPHLKGSEESITVFAGTVAVTVGEERVELGRGDSIRFRADLPHAYENPGEAQAELSMLIYYRR